MPRLDATPVFTLESYEVYSMTAAFTGLVASSLMPQIAISGVMLIGFWVTDHRFNRRDISHRLSPDEVAKAQAESPDAFRVLMSSGLVLVGDDEAYHLAPVLRHMLTKDDWS